jgi:hypothetical protein
MHIKFMFNLLFANGTLNFHLCSVFICLFMCVIVTYFDLLISSLTGPNGCVV